MSSQKISQGGRDVRREECCSIKHKHKPQHTSAHVLLTPSEQHTQKSSPHAAKKQALFKVQVRVQYYLEQPPSPPHTHTHTHFFFVTAENIKRPKKRQLFINYQSWRARRASLQIGQRWARGVWQNLHKWSTAMLTSWSVEAETSPPRPHTQRLSPRLTSDDTSSLSL